MRRRGVWREEKFQRRGGGAALSRNLGWSAGGSAGLGGQQAGGEWAISLRSEGGDARPERRLSVSRPWNFLSEGRVLVSIAQAGAAVRWRVAGAGEPR